MERAEFDRILRRIEAGEITGFEPTGGRFVSIADRSKRDGHGVVRILSQRDGHPPRNLSEYTEFVASTVRKIKCGPFEGDPPTLPISHGKATGSPPAVPPPPVPG